MAILFGKEDFEGGSLPASFDSNVNSFGTATLVADATSKVVGTYSLGCSTIDESARYLEEDLGSGYSEWYIQFKIFLPTGWVFPTGGFLTLFGGSATAGSFNLEIKLEDYGTARVIVQGTDIPYEDTGIDIPLNTVTKVEVRVVKNATTGIVQVWLNNDTEGSPDFSVTAINSGAATMRYLEAGLGYCPAAMTSLYLDDIIVADAFIGAGAPPATLEQEGFIFREDDGNETGATSIAAQDTDIDRDRNTNTRLRVLVNADGDADPSQFQLEVRKNGTSDPWQTVQP